MKNNLYSIWYEPIIYPSSCLLYATEATAATTIFYYVNNNSDDSIDNNIKA